MPVSLVEAAPTAAPGADAPWQVNIKNHMRSAGDSKPALLQYHLLAGEIALGRHDLTVAAKQYAAALKLAPSAALAQRAAQVAAAADRHDLAYAAVKIWAADAPHDAQAEQAAVRLALINDDAAGVAHFVPLLAATAENTRIGYELAAHLLGGAPDHVDTAIAGMKQVAANHADQPAAAYALALVAYGYEKLDVAADAVAGVRKADPSWTQPALLSAAIDVHQGHLDKARQAIAGLKGDAKTRANGHMLLARMLLQAGQAKAAAGEFHAALAIDPKDADARYGLGVVALSEDNLDAAKKQFAALTHDKDHGGDADFYLGLIAERENRPADARHWYAKVDSGSHVFEAGVRGALLNAQAGHVDAALKTLDRLSATQTGHTDEIAAAKGQILVQAHRLQDALALYNKTLADDPDASDARYGRALVYEQLGQIKNAEADLAHLIGNNDNNAEALNALGYMLTTHSTDYARAEKLIRHALAEDPDAPEILDSLGWVQYKRGDLKAAQKNLEKAWADDNDPEIAIHLGTVRWADGDHAAARAVWQKAAKVHPDDKKLQKIMKEHGS